ncbi:hypothetical protein HYH02_007462 [Chlamydomonas schloesseri]|uniref:BACK domain-containing protein n=1 Tax=Chlamydomonas schloesseri TaxID=2026947 RepID=A0A835WHB5_9CHLO|nr:hypothetical protein HYH02_007462 [Chlamydomonas schloesseri]|eukprot:KAG2447538.1 hypothetical protein HYH02_007462 [Chlamydomonas schloesseri]
MAAAINPRVASGITGLFGKSERADCRLVFVLDPSPPTAGDDPHLAKDGDGAAASKRANGDRALQQCGEPLPAHSLVLQFASDKIKAQLEWLATEGASAGPANKKARKSAAAAATAGKELPEVQLMLGSEKELPAAHAAVKFAYTGMAELNSIREALQVRRQAAYLQMEGCEQACTAAIKEMLAQGRGSGTAGSASTSSGGGAAAPTAPPPVLELYSCTELWPDLAEDAAFAALLTEAKLQLVAHFGDTLAVLNNKELYEQMRALPAVGLEALLESDDFGTDSESSVVLVLAEWMAANHATTDEDTRRRLCGLLRLVQCSRAYLSCVLPVLAARHQEDSHNTAGWFPISPTEATCLLTYSLVTVAERTAMAGEGEPYGPCGGMEGWPPAWRSTQPRRQCLPAEGRRFSFEASVEDLERVFGALGPGGEGILYPRMCGARHADCIVALGLDWTPYATWEFDSAAAGMRLGAEIPAALKAAGSGAAGPAAEQLLTKAVVSFPRAQLSVCGAGGLVTWSGDFDRSHSTQAGYGRGWVVALILKKLATAGRTADGGGHSNRDVPHSSGMAARWAPYLQGGTCLKGSVTLLPPAQPAPAPPPAPAPAAVPAASGWRARVGGPGAPGRPRGAR